MIGWYTDNPLSKTVLGSIPNIEIKHVCEFGKHCDSIGPERDYEPGIFYGMLRGASHLMHIYHNRHVDYFYIDNGYFDALYVDKAMHKNMGGKFRVVKNGLHEVYPKKESILYAEIKNILVIPPSPYSANFYDTIPEDWQAQIMPYLSGYNTRIRTKAADCAIEYDLEWCDGVVAFNSMAVMKAVEMDKMVVDTHGIFRNFNKLATHPGYDIADLRVFYESKQFTLEELRRGKWI